MKFYDFQIDEICFFGIVLSFIAITIIILWKTTERKTLTYNLWLIQLQQNNNQNRIIRIVPMSDPLAQEHERRIESEGDQNNRDNRDTPIEPDQSAQVTSLLIIQTPTSIEQNIHTQISNHQSMEQLRRHDNSLPNNTDMDHPQQITHNQRLNINAESTTHCFTPSERETLTIRLKFLDDTQMLIQTHKFMPVGVFKREHFSEHLNQGKIIRLIFQGRLLRDDQATLNSYGVHDQCVLHCHIGTRPYSTSNNDNPNLVENEAERQSNTNDGNYTLGARLVPVNVWIDLLLLYAWNVIMFIWEWSNQVDVVVSEDRSILCRIKEKIRNSTRILLDILFGASIRNINSQQRADIQFNIGQLLAFLVFVKFILLWSLILFFPHFADRRSIFLLSLLTTITGLYFYFNRTNTSQRRVY